MTREDAAREIDNTACCFSDKRFRDSMHMAAAALRGPQPDSETGLVPCGCGGKVAIAKYPGFLDTPDLYQVDCFKCNVGTRPAVSPEIVRNDWNGAMGWRMEG